MADTPQNKTVKIQLVLTHFGRLRIRLCAAPSDWPHQTRGANSKNPGRESHLQNRVHAGKDKGAIWGAAISQGTCGKNMVRHVRPSKATTYIREPELLKSIRFCKSNRGNYDIFSQPENRSSADKRPRSRITYIMEGED